MTTTFNVKDIVCVKSSTSPAKVIRILDNGYVKVEWLDKGAKWATEFPLTELTLAGGRRRRSKPHQLEADEAPKKKSKTKEKSIETKKIVTVKSEVVVKAPPEAASSEMKREETDNKLTTTKKLIKYDKAPDLWQVTGIKEGQGIKEVAKLLPKDLKKCSQEVIHFFLFCYERQMVWERRNNGDCDEDGQYTDSWAMQNYFFCNNYRELDRGTNYFRAHILHLWDKYNKDGPVDHQTWMELVLWASICYRLVNRISTFEDFGCIPEIDDWPRFRTFLQKKAKQPCPQIFTDAHFSAGMNSYVPNMKALYEKNGKLVREHNQNILECCQDKDLKGCFDQLKKVSGIGNFLAWQVICDLMESQCLEPCDENDWTELGPGAKSGIDIIFGAGKTQNYKYLDLAVRLQKIQDDVFDALGVRFPKWNGEHLTLKNIEHPLCEFSKYTSIQGKLRRNVPIAGQRRKKSRSDMDIDKACHNVKTCGEKDDILLCDKCLVGFCEKCAGPRDSSSVYWLCPRCMAFEAVSFE